MTQDVEDIKKMADKAIDARDKYALIEQAEELQQAFQVVKDWHEETGNHRLQSARVNLRKRIEELLQGEVHGLDLSPGGNFEMWLNDHNMEWSINSLLIKGEHGASVTLHIIKSAAMPLDEIEAEDDGEDATEPNSL
ncbi:MAG: hypothetical protein CL607_14985 [Anaerolineaceae bacterium]|nr:hypothetical protein [Anaerolineaceae bacterium]